MTSVEDTTRAIPARWALYSPVGPESPAVRVESA